MCENDQSNETWQVDTNITDSMNRKEVRLLLRDSKVIATPTTTVMQYFVVIVFWFLVNCKMLSVQPPECFYRYILLNYLYKKR